MTPYTGPANRSYSASNAAWSPRATWMSRSSRSRSPLLSAVADLNRDGSESFGFIWHLRDRNRIGWVEDKRILNNLARGRLGRWRVSSASHRPVTGDPDRLGPGAAARRRSPGTRARRA